MNISYEYKQFLFEKIMEYLPKPYVRNGSRINCRCPFCGDSKKSSTKKRGWVYADKDCSYYCFNCGLSLSGIKLIEALSGANYEDIKHEYVKLFLKSGLSNSLSSFSEPQSEEPNIFEFKSIINPDWKNNLSDDAKKYLSDRRVLDAPFREDPLYSCYNKDKNEEFILIPWIINGVDAYYQVNDFKKFHSMKYIFPKNKHKLVYGLDNIDISWPYIIVFEGAYDSMFVKNGVAVGTKSITDYQLKLIKDRYPKMTICCSFDNDLAGISSMVRLIKNNTNMKFFKWFNQNTKQKDINDYVLAKDDINAFTDKNVLEKLIVDPLQMKWYLIQSGAWKEEEKKAFEKKQQLKKQNMLFRAGKYML